MDKSGAAMMGGIGSTRSSPNLGPIKIVDPDPPNVPGKLTSGWRCQSPADFCRVYRQLKRGRSGDEVRPGWGVNGSHRFAEPGEKPAHLCLGIDVFRRRCNSRRRISEFGADAPRPLRRFHHGINSTKVRYTQEALSFTTSRCRSLCGRIDNYGTLDLRKDRGPSPHKISVDFLHACFLAVRTRSVLADKFSGGGRDGVSSGALRRGVLAGAS
jgi:hypothetical protein